MKPTKFFSDVESEYSVYNESATTELDEDISSQDSSTIIMVEIDKWTKNPTKNVITANYCTSKSNCLLL